MNVEELSEELGNWDRGIRVTIEGDGDILSFEPDGHGGLLILCGDDERERDYDNMDDERIRW